MNEEPGKGTDRQRSRDRLRARSRRFTERYERRKAERLRGAHHPWKRPIRVGTGVMLIIGGVAIGWLPGPGFVILALPGAFLVASEIRWAAIAMDRAEHETVPRVRRVWRRLRRRGAESGTLQLDAEPDHPPTSTANEDASHRERD